MRKFSSVYMRFANNRHKRTHRTNPMTVLLLLKRVFHTPNWCECLALFPFTFSQLCIDKRAFLWCFLSHRAHVFSLPSAERIWIACLLARKSRRYDFSVNIGFISVKDVADVATLFAYVRLKPGKDNNCLKLSINSFPFSCELFKEPWKKLSFFLVLKFLKI